MPNFICTTCGVQYGESEAPPQSCVICSEERQYIGWQGQQWTTLDELRRDHRSRIEPEGSGLTGIGIEPTFAAHGLETRQSRAIEQNPAMRIAVHPRDPRAGIRVPAPRDAASGHQRESSSFSRSAASFASPDFGYRSVSVM